VVSLGSLFRGFFVEEAGRSVWYSVGAMGFFIEWVVVL
jgi:hypothetical protein